MKTFNQFLTERDEQPLHTGRNSFYAPQPNYGTHKTPDKQIQIFSSPHFQDKGKYFVPSDKVNLMVNGGEWWASFDEVVWDGSTLKKTGYKTNISLAPIDERDGARIVDNKTLTQ